MSVGSYLGFDIGDTLVEYGNFPLSWEPYYPNALSGLADAWKCSFGDAETERGCAMLRLYNTRLHPRKNEIAFLEVAEKLAAVFNFTGPVDEQASAAAFFRFFRQRLRCFPDTIDALRRLRERGARIGLFTDVPYGMPREFVLDDLAQSGLDGLYDTLITSRDAGFRKPSPGTLGALARAMGCAPSELTYIGNERKDVEVALAVGCQAILLDRAGTNPQWQQHRTIHSLEEF